MQDAKRYIRKHEAGSNYAEYLYTIGVRSKAAQDPIAGGDTYWKTCITIVSSFNDTLCEHISFAASSTYRRVASTTTQQQRTSVYVYEKLHRAE